MRVASAALFLVGCAAWLPGDHIPSEFNRPHDGNVIHATPDEVRDICTRLGDRGFVRFEDPLACAVFGPEFCTVLIPFPEFLPPYEYVRRLKHERAHCNGWTHE